MSAVCALHSRVHDLSSSHTLNSQTLSRLKTLPLRVAPAASEKNPQRTKSSRLLMKVTDVTLDIVNAQDRPLVVVVVVVLMLLIGAATQLVLYHLIKIVE